MNNKNGFSLIETLIYLAIVAMACVSFVSFTLAINQSSGKIYASQEAQANSRAVLGFISQRIRKADNVLSPLEGNSSSTLVLDMPFPEQDLTFRVENGTLVLQEGLSLPVSLTSGKVNVSSLNFANLAASGERDNISIEAVFQYAGSDSAEYKYSQALKTGVSIRK